MISVVIPWRAGCPHRERALDWLTGWYARTHPTWEVVLGRHDDGPWNASAAIIDGAAKASGEILVAHDADCAIDPAEATEHLESGWSIPHLMVHRLSRESSDLFMAGFDLKGLQLDRSNRQDGKPYTGHAGGGVVVLTREAFDAVPPDVRFAGWGHQDDAWALALRTLIGAPWRGKRDLIHLWHPPQERLSRTVGSEESHALFRRYQFAARKPDRMRALIEEAA